MKAGSVSVAASELPGQGPSGFVTVVFACHSYLWCIRSRTYSWRPAPQSGWSP